MPRITDKMIVARVLKTRTAENATGWDIVTAYEDLREEAGNPVEAGPWGGTSSYINEARVQRVSDLLGD